MTSCRVIQPRSIHGCTEGAWLPVIVGVVLRREAHHQHGHIAQRGPRGPGAVRDAGNSMLAGMYLWTRYTHIIGDTTDLVYTLPILQEVMWHQLQDIDKLIGSEYDHVSAGREDGDKRGEVSCTLLCVRICRNHADVLLASLLQACPIFWNR